ncbi:hypothetical protein [Fibrella forsythiae]|uniref:Uncharacterized protein n=1 Tax=Fibrella forsythiae TaxID=2817061 RepID=A0ABS3JV00_9BACT|nr:hypothetical protein [Fibrella forsythiae]MBO0953206.1 hypothetical protein [Fibrella forsythiae]
MGLVKLVIQNKTGSPGQATGSSAALVQSQALSSPYGASEQGKVVARYNGAYEQYLVFMAE